MPEKPGLRPDFKKMPPLLFRTEVAILEDEVNRGPKGAGCHSESTFKGRSSVGHLIGIDASSYVVKLSREVLVV